MSEGLISSVQGQNSLGMMPQLKNIGDVQKGLPTTKLGGVEGISESKKTPSFSEVMKATIDGADKAQKNFDGAVKDLASGKSTSIHEVMMKQKEAELSFKLMVETTKRATEAYRKLIEMNV